VKIITLAKGVNFADKTDTLRIITEVFGSIDKFIAYRNKDKSPNSFYQSKYLFIKNPKLSFAEKDLISLVLHLKDMFSIQVNL
jgi:hypothetical protein